jgi:DNA-binding response OmpR family regulator
MRLLVIEDERRVANFISRALRENAYAVDAAETGEKGLAMALETSYDGILLDVRLPGMNGVEVCRAIRQARIATPILMLTAQSLVEQRVEGLDAGADDYLTKPFALAELLARVRAMGRRRITRSGEMVLRNGPLELDRSRRRLVYNHQMVTLTTKEYSLLEFLMLRAPDAVTRSEIIEHVWDAHFDSESNLVEVYINRLRQKIGAKSGQKIIHTVHGVGYRISPSE